LPAIARFALGDAEIRTTDGLSSTAAARRRDA